jgi:hypothetical protein
VRASVQPLAGQRIQGNQPKLSRVDVAYTDGTALTYLFPRTIRIADLSALISRAGQVRKVAL